MITIQFHGNQDIFEGLKLFEADMDFSLSADGAYTLNAVACRQDGLKVELDKKTITVTYSEPSRFYRAWGYVYEALQAGKERFAVEEHPVFAKTGIMLDVSRNAVMKPDAVCFLLRRLALMGVNEVMLYTEDTYKVDGKPYFGYMRGRYTHEEIKRMDDYAFALGIELIPCIQTLGHLATYLRWSEAGAYKDTANILLAGAPETYAFIEKLFETVKSCFRSRRVHIGMDETFELGRGAYLQKNGFCDQRDIYLKHLQTVAALADRYGFKPMIWSDMFFRLSGKDLKNYTDYDVRTQLDEALVSAMPANVQPVFWDYYNPDENFYAVNLQKHDKMPGETVFAGGVWAWSGHGVQFSRSITNTVPALEACKKHGTKEVVATLWHNGSEAGLPLTLAGVQMYAEYAFSGKYDEKAIAAGFMRSCGARYDDFLLSEAVEYPHGDRRYTGATRGILYNDVLCGLVDAHIKPYDMRGYYQSLSPQLEKTVLRNGSFNDWLNVLYRLSLFLEYKADFGVRLKAAYEKGDKEALAAFALECDTMQERLSDLRKAHRKAWMAWNKPFGWEVHDIRYGGIANRIDTAKERLQAYLAGETDALEELAEPRLRIDGTGSNIPDFFMWSLWWKYERLTTANIL